jgi:alpha-glucoside transport system substrate-binding protein
MVGRRNSRILFSVIVILTLLLAACAGGDQTTATTAPTQGAAPENTPTTAAPAGEPTATTEAGAGTGDGETATPEVEATEPADGATPAPGGAWQGEQIGGTVRVLAIWGGAEQDAFLEMMRPFEEQTGITIEYESTRDLGAVLNTRVSGGNPPDVAALPNPGQLVALAQSGALKPLDDVLDMNMMNEQYDPGFTQLTQVDGQMYGIFTKASVKSLVWYNPKAFDAAGYTVPTTWEELRALEQQIQTDGGTPWCIGIDGGGGSGWPGTDWIEDIVLHQAGPEVYDQWVNHEIPWTDPAIRQAFETFGEFVNDEAVVYGGPQAVAATNFGQAFNPMFEAEPGCYLFKQANFITTFFQDQFPDLVAGEDYNFFVFPAINEEAGSPLLVAGDMFGMFNDTPQARAMMQYLVTTDAQQVWAQRGGFLSANRTMDPAVYPDQITSQIGQMLAEATAVRFDASDLMPEAVNSAFSTAILQVPGNPGQLDSILQTIEAQAAESYQAQ